MIPVPEQYVVQTFYQFVPYAYHQKHNNTYNGCCPFCKEGKSYGKKTRFFYIPKKELTYCHNCGYSHKVLKFIMDVTGKSMADIVADINEHDFDVGVPLNSDVPVDTPAKHTLPEDSINLSDAQQLLFHQNNAIVAICNRFIESRRLNTAVNRPSTYYLSLTDHIHKNRLVLPVYNTDGDIIFYQTRTILPRDNATKPKYLSKVGGEKSLSGLNNMDIFHDNVYLFEGQIDSYFVVNGLAVGGIQEDSERSFSELQTSQLAHLSMYNKVWCLDNQWIDKPAWKKSITLAEQGQNVFIWPKQFSMYKDINEMCVDLKRDQIKHSFIQKNTHQGLKALIMLKQIQH